MKKTLVLLSIGVLAFGAAVFTVDGKIKKANAATSKYQVGGVFLDDDGATIGATWEWDGTTKTLTFTEDTNLYTETDSNYVCVNVGLPANSTIIVNDGVTVTLTSYIGDAMYCEGNLTIIGTGSLSCYGSSSGTKYSWGGSGYKGDDSAMGNGATVCGRFVIGDESTGEGPHLYFTCGDGEESAFYAKNYDSDSSSDPHIAIFGGYVELGKDNNGNWTKIWSDENHHVGLFNHASLKFAYDNTRVIVSPDHKIGDTYYACVYTLAYNGNGNETGTAPIGGEVGCATTITVPDKGTMDKDGYDLVSWNTAADGSGLGYSIGDKFQIVSNMTLYAQWLPYGEISTNPSAITGLTYTGEAQALVNAGVSSDGTIVYKIGDNGIYSEEIPTGVNVGSYTIYYKLLGDSEHADGKDEGSVVVSISVNDKSDLEAKITEITLAYNSLKTSYPATAAPLKTVIEEAEEVVDEDNKTTGEISAAITALNDALTSVNANKDKVDAVISAIDAIGEVSLEKAQAISDARASYVALEEGIRSDVNNYEKLVNSENLLAKLGFVSKVNAIPDPVEYTPECKEKIDEARACYNSLSDDQKALVEPETLKVLTDAEKTYGDYEHYHQMAEDVKVLINAIGEVSYTQECEEKIKAARTAYNALDDVQKTYIDADTLKVLTDAEAEYARLDADYVAASDVSLLIATIGQINYPSSHDAIVAARSAYDALTEAQKELVDNYVDLVLIERVYAQLELDATRHELDDETSGVSIETDTGKGIPTDINLVVEVKSSVSAPEGSVEYEAIKSQLDSHQIILTVYDVKLVTVVGGEERVIQPSDIQDGMKIIVHIPLPDGVDVEKLRILHIHGANDMEFIQTFEVFEGEIIFEVSRLSEFAFILTKTMPVWAIILMVVGGLIVLCALVYLSLFFLFNKWIKKDDKAVRVFKVGKKDGKARVMLMPCKFEYKEENEIFNSRAEALK